MEVQMEETCLRRVWAAQSALVMSDGAMKVREELGHPSQVAAAPHRSRETADGCVDGGQSPIGLQERLHSVDIRNTSNDPLYLACWLYRKNPNPRITDYCIFNGSSSSVVSFTKPTGARLSVM